MPLSIRSISLISVQADRHCLIRNCEQHFGRADHVCYNRDRMYEGTLTRAVVDFQGDKSTDRS